MARLGCSLLPHNRDVRAIVAKRMDQALECPVRCWATQIVNRNLS